MKLFILKVYVVNKLGPLTWFAYDLNIFTYSTWVKEDCHLSKKVEGDLLFEDLAHFLLRLFFLFTLWKETSIGLYGHTFLGLSLSFNNALNQIYNLWRSLELNLTSMSLLNMATSFTYTLADNLIYTQFSWAIFHTMSWDVFTIGTPNDGSNTTC